jgi:CheY-like chemotaxis protein
VLRFGRLLEGKRILWIDRNPENNTPATKGLLVEAAREAGNLGAEVVEVRTVDQGVEMLRQAQANEGPPFDLVISHWGREWNAAEQLLREIRRRELEVPTLIFAANTEVAHRKRKAQALGAQGYYHSWAGLRRGIEQVFDSGVETG